MLDVPGLGPKRARLLNEQLGVSALGDLVAAAKAGKVRKLRGFGAKTEQRILQEAEKRAATTLRIKRPVAEDIAKPLLRYLSEAKGIRHAEVAGSYRRCRETVGDLDIVVAAARSAGIIERFVGYEDVARKFSRAGPPDHRPFCATASRLICASFRRRVTAQHCDISPGRRRTTSHCVRSLPRAG